MSDNGQNSSDVTLKRHFRSILFIEKPWNMWYYIITARETIWDPMLKRLNSTASQIWSQPSARLNDVNVMRSMPLNTNHDDSEKFFSPIIFVFNFLLSAAYADYLMPFAESPSKTDFFLFYCIRYIGEKNISELSCCFTPVWIYSGYHR